MDTRSKLAASLLRGMALVKRAFRGEERPPRLAVRKGKAYFKPNVIKAKRRKRG